MSETTELPPLVPQEGWHVLHLYYRMDWGAWRGCDASEREENRRRFVCVQEEIAAIPEVQLVAFAVVGNKADVGWMLTGPSLQVVNRAEKRLGLALGPGMLEPVYSYYSMTERSEYTTSEEEYARGTLVGERGLVEGSAEYASALEEFRVRIEKYTKDRLYPNLADWPVICFYPMNKRRVEGANWYALAFEERKKLMGGHARVGRQWAGKIRQLITGSTGLDTHEWGVTLFAKDSYDIKGIVYEMRFDEVSARYAEFGDFYIGLRLSPAELLDRLLLREDAG